MIQADLLEQCAEVEVGLQRHMVEPIPRVFADRLRTRQAAAARRPFDDGHGEAALAEPPCQRHPEHASTNDAHRRHHGPPVTHPPAWSAWRWVSRRSYDRPPDPHEPVASCAARPMT